MNDVPFLKGSSDRNKVRGENLANNISQAIYRITNSRKQIYRITISRILNQQQYEYNLNIEMM